MRRSLRVDVPLVVRVAAAALLVGCGADHRLEAQRCVTRDWEVVPDAQCESQPPTSGRVSGGGTHYFWYYGGRGTAVGERVSGGSVIPPSSGVVTRPNSGGFAIHAPGGVSTRGGFGSSLHGGGGHLGTAS